MHTVWNPQAIGARAQGERGIVAYHVAIILGEGTQQLLPLPHACARLPQLLLNLRELERLFCLWRGKQCGLS